MFTSKILRKNLVFASDRALDDRQLLRIRCRASVVVVVAAVVVVVVESQL